MGTAAELESLFCQVEQAIKGHPKLRQVSGLLGEPEFRCSRLGCTVRVKVQLRGSRKKSSEITGDGDDFAGAVADLVRKLDLWAEAIA